MTNKPTSTTQDKEDLAEALAVLDQNFEIAAHADTSVDEEIFTALHRAHIKAVDKINSNIKPYLHHLVAEVPADYKFTAADLHLPRLRYNYPEPYAAAEFQRTHDWMVEWGLINKESTFDKLVDVRVVA